MTFSVEIDDRLVTAIDQHLDTQLLQQPDVDTGAQKVVRKFKDAQAFLEDVLQQTVHQLVRMYPPDHLRASFAAAKKADDDLKSACKPKRLP